MSPQRELYVAYGRTESGDELPVCAFEEAPTEDLLLKVYKQAVPDEFEAFGDEFMLDCIQVRLGPLIKPA